MGLHDNFTRDASVDNEELTKVNCLWMGI